MWSYGAGKEVAYFLNWPLLDWKLVESLRVMQGRLPACVFTSTSSNAATQRPLDMMTVVCIATFHLSMDLRKAIGRELVKT